MGEEQPGGDSAEIPESRWRRLVRERQGAISAEILDELAEHLADVYAAHRRDGCDVRDAQARTLALLERSSFDDLKARRRSVRQPSALVVRARSCGPRPWHDLGFDLRYAWRRMRREPVFSAAVIAILAVAVGATTAGFAVIDAVLWRALPYPEAERLMVIKHVTVAGESRAHAAADWRDYAARHRSQMTIAAHASWPMNVTGAGEPERLRSIIVSGTFFDVVSPTALLGRVIRESDDAPGAPPVAVLSYGFWQRRFGGDPKSIGQSITLNGRSVTIVGVTPPDFAYPAPAPDVWMPMGLPSAVLDDRASEWVSIVARLQPGVELRDAQRELDATAALLAAAYPATNFNERVAIHPVLDDIVGGVRRALVLGGLAVAFVLIAGCANAANLMTTRTTFRRDEIAIRSALGAEPIRLARQVVVESLVLAGCGGVLGIGAAVLFSRAFVVLADGRVPRIDQLALNGTTLLVAMATCVGSGLMFGGVSAWLLIRETRDRGISATSWASRSNRVARVMLATQVAFALAVTAGAAVVARSYSDVMTIDPGFDVTNTLTLQLSLPRTRYADSAAHHRFAQRTLAQIATLPGIESAGVVSDLPFVGNALHFRVRPLAAAGEGDMITVRPADGGFFRTLRIAALAGRLFGDGDRVTQSSRRTDQSQHGAASRKGRHAWATDRHRRRSGANDRRHLARYQARRSSC